MAAAIADSVRREILEMLRVRPLPARRIAACFPISRPAVSRHLRVLRECGLVHDTATGRERHYRLDATRLAEISDWLAGFTTPAAPHANADQSPAGAGTAGVVPVGAAAAGVGAAGFEAAGLEAAGLEAAGVRPAGAQVVGVEAADVDGVEVVGVGAADAGAVDAGAAGVGAAGLWDRRLDALETEVQRTRRDRRRGGAAPDRQEKTA